jgi:hypothetical protein
VKTRLRLLGRALVLLCTVALGGCQKEDGAPITVELGGGRSHRFVPVVALARYVEIPAAPDELRIVLASYRIGCDSFSPPPPGEVFASVVALVPDGATIGPGEFSWPGALPEGKLGEALVVPTVGLAEGSRLVEARGKLRLDQVELADNGRVTGQLLFAELEGAEPGAPAPTTRLSGGFSARFCALSLDPARARQPE